MSNEAFQQQSLQGVSRTFALTIPRLPPSLCRSIGNGYLLCRIADTIEDEPSLTAEQKHEFFQKFIDVVAGKQSAFTFSRALYPRLSDSMLPAERQLVFDTEKVIQITHSLPQTQQAILLRCVKIMSNGMSEFQFLWEKLRQSQQGLSTLTQMNDYCYYVAGVVGEMVTDLFCDYSPAINQHRQSLRTLALSFGQGLQMTNILKDIWDDQARGACWLPSEEFAKVGFDLRTLNPNNYQPAFGEGLSQLIGVAHHHLHNTLRYICLLPSKEVEIRCFCLWTMAMSLLTLKKLQKHLDFKDGQQVKISRRSVKLSYLVSRTAARSNLALKILFYLTSYPLKEVTVEPLTPPQQVALWELPEYRLI
ncbi:phytoene/squalene synthetase [Beggiatoa alba B18LD]|uniref:Phytoene/squalene synthetase n=1 Tax=Beggiatoa alba B18LD TaxID=395493 RepID=I3CBW7_9GAMM|nr:phytoene/squalene synthase family protein [Beggiatoa alba]EIJ41110.1 phytoene/squalene synthetase [Beggiatoa alba B18LD]